MSMLHIEDKEDISRSHKWKKEGINLSNVKRNKGLRKNEEIELDSEDKEDN